MIIITINTDGDAFETAPDYELTRLLSQVRAYDGVVEERKLIDSNGNTVGFVEVTDES